MEFVFDVREFWHKPNQTGACSPHLYKKAEKIPLRSKNRGYHREKKREKEIPQRGEEERRDPTERKTEKRRTH